MIAARLRECLKILRWNAADLAEELGYPQDEVATWLDGRARAPLAVAAWLEALVKTYRTLPRPCRTAPAFKPGTEKAETPEIRLPTPAVAQAIMQGSPAVPLPRRSASAGRYAAASANGGADRGAHAL